MSKGVLAIFAQSSPVSLNSIESFANLYKVPFITTLHPAYKPDQVQDMYHEKKNHYYDQEQVDESDDEDQYSNQKDQNAGFENQENYNFMEKQNINSNTMTMNSNNENSFSHTKNENQNFHLTMHPDMVPLLVSFIKYSQWKTIYYIYNHDEALNRLEGLLNFQMRETDFVTDILVRKVDNITDSFRLLK
jgi:hypothetical protein